MNKYMRISIILLFAMITMSCAGVNTFSQYARTDETVSILLGYQPNFNKRNISLTVTPSGGTPIIIPQGDPSIRAVTNMYPDPLSSMRVSQDISSDLTPGASTYANTIEFITAGDSDWYQTILLLDLPSLPTGFADITVTDGVDSITATVEIISGAGSATVFDARLGSGGGSPFVVSSDMLNSLQRVEHFVIDINVDGELPHAVQLTLLHDPDSSVGGSGITHVVNPLSNKKSLNWSDDGTTTKIILLPTAQNTIQKEKDFKFYVTGGITNVTVQAVDAFDIDGNSITSGVSATSTAI